MMSRARYIYISLLLTAAAATYAHAQESITETVKRVAPAVVTVITYDDSGSKNSQGSGFFIDQSHVITDWHVLEGASKVEVRCADGTVYQIKAVTAGDDASDLASVELTKPNKTVKPLKITNIIPEAGERVVVVGSPFGLDASISDGVVSGIRNIPDLGNVIQISAPISRGSSGSPVVNLKGEVVGVAQAVRGDAQNLNFAIPAAQVLALKPGRSNQFAMKPADEGSGPSTAGNDSYNKGMALFQAKSYDKALPYFMDAVKQDPKNYLAWFTAGHCYINMNKYKEAAMSFLGAVKAKPDFVEGYCSLGAALGLMGEHKTALQAFSIAAKLDPKSAIAHYGMGLTYLGLGQKDNALKEYGILQDLDPSLAEHLGTLIKQ